MENALVVLFHFIITRDKQLLGDQDYVFFSLYDCVNWCFLEYLLYKFSFSSQFVSLIMRCISTMAIETQIMISLLKY